MVEKQDMSGKKRLASPVLHDLRVMAKQGREYKQPKWSFSARLADSSTVTGCKAAVPSGQKESAEVFCASYKDATWTASKGNVPGMLHWAEAPGESQDILEGLSYTPRTS